MHKALGSIPGNRLAEQAGEASLRVCVTVLVCLSVCVCVHIYPSCVSLFILLTLVSAVSAEYVCMRVSVPVCVCACVRARV